MARIAVISHGAVGLVLARLSNAEVQDSTRLAFRFLILTNAHPREVLNARWDEMDRERAIWTVPAGRIEKSKERRVPLSSQALGVLGEARELGCGAPVFPSGSSNPLCGASLSELLCSLGLDAGVHLFRRSFHRWSTRTRVALEIVQAHADHLVADDLAPRRALLEEWGAYVSPFVFHDTPTFAELAAAIHGHALRYSSSPRSTQRSIRTLELHVLPHIGERPVCDIGLRDVLDVLEPVWTTKPAAAKKALSAVRQVLNYAMSLGLRADNPAHAAVAAHPPVERPVVSPVLAHNELAGVLAAVRGSRARNATKLAFEFLLLTARRPGEICAAHWDHMDLQDAVWTLPVEPMQRDRLAVNRVPLSRHAFGVLYEARELNGGSGLVFSNGSDRPVSSSSLSALLRRLDLKVRPISFRKTFRQWCAESGVSEYVARACLGRLGGPWVEGANFLSDVLVDRRPVMEDWGVQVAGESRSRGR